MVGMARPYFSLFFPILSHFSMVHLSLCIPLICKSRVLRKFIIQLQASFEYHTDIKN